MLREDEQQLQFRLGSLVFRRKNRRAEGERAPYLARSATCILYDISRTSSKAGMSRLITTDFPRESNHLALYLSEQLTYLLDVALPSMKG